MIGNISARDVNANDMYLDENSWEDTHNAKISLMYVHDYYYAYQSGGLNCSGTSTSSHLTCVKSWIHYLNNDSEFPSEWENTMSHSSATNTKYEINSYGGISIGYHTSELGSRPVFYLNADEQYISGDGTLDNPIMLVDKEGPIIVVHPSDVTITLGDTNATFIVMSNEENITYQWQYKEASATAWTNSPLSSAQTATLLVPVNELWRNGYQYRCVLSDNLGNQSISKSAILTILQPAGTTIQGKKPTGLNTTMQGGLYRFQGTAANNYICFGTTSKEECTSNTDAYMYRIIGINSSGQLKLIKKEALNTAYYWYNSYSSNITWPNSDLFKGLNGKSGGTYSNLFIGNSTYMPSGWSDKIADTTWKYGDNATESQTSSALYNTENSWTGKTTAKIGLMYAHDYAYGLSGGNNCSSAGPYSTCKTSWIHLSNNDSESPQSHEWTMSRYGSTDSYYYAWYVNVNGNFSMSFLPDVRAVRPVFFLKSTVNFIGGTGTASDPFIVS